MALDLSSQRPTESTLIRDWAAAVGVHFGDIALGTKLCTVLNKSGVFVVRGLRLKRRSEIEAMFENDDALAGLIDSIEPFLNVSFSDDSFTFREDVVVVTGGSLPPAEKKPKSEAPLLFGEHVSDFPEDFETRKANYLPKVLPPMIVDTLPAKLVLLPKGNMGLVTASITTYLFVNHRAVHWARNGEGKCVRLLANHPTSARVIRAQLTLCVTPPDVAETRDDRRQLTLG